MGAGPERLMESGLIERLEQAGHEVVPCSVCLPSQTFMPEVQAAFELDRRLATCVAEAVAAGALPVILSGNCITSVGTVAGIGEPDLGVVWLDAHGDFNTPETTLGGFLDGMALATLTGRCWTSLAATVPGFGLIVHHTDAEREFAYDREHVVSGQLDKALDEVGEYGWVLADMKRDWKVVFPTGERSARPDIEKIG